MIARPPQTLLLSRARQQSGQDALHVVAVLLEVALDQGIDEAAVLVGEGAACLQDLAERPGLVLDPIARRRQQLRTVDEVHSQGNDAEEQVAVGGQAGHNITRNRAIRPRSRHGITSGAHRLKYKRRTAPAATRHAPPKLVSSKARLRSEWEVGQSAVRTEAESRQDFPARAKTPLVAVGPSGLPTVGQFWPAPGTIVSAARQIAGATFLCFPASVCRWILSSLVSAAPAQRSRRLSWSRLVAIITLFYFQAAARAKTLLLGVLEPVRGTASTIKPARRETRVPPCRARLQSHCLPWRFRS